MREKEAVSKLSVIDPNFSSTVASWPIGEHKPIGDAFVVSNVRLGRDFITDTLRATAVAAGNSRK